MAEQDWLRPERLTEQRGPAPSARGGLPFTLRPLSLGELLDRSFSLYRSRFWLFAGISMVAAAVYTVAQGFSLASANRVLEVKPQGNTPGAVLTQLRMVGSLQLKSYAVLLLFVLVSSITQAAISFAVAELYVGRPMEVKSALRSVGARWARWIGIALWQMGSAAWVPALAALLTVPLLALGARGNKVGLLALGGGLLALAVLGGVPVGVWLYLRNALAVPVAAVENLPLRAAMRRSKDLSRGTRGRIFVVLLVAYVLLQVVSVLEAPLSLFLVLGRGGQHILLRGLALLLTFVGHTVVAPFAALGLTMVYFDQRVRREALDLDLLLQAAGEPDAGEAAGPSPAGSHARFR